MTAEIVAFPSGPRVVLPWLRKIFTTGDTEVHRGERGEEKHRSIFPRPGAGSANVTK